MRSTATHLLLTGVVLLLAGCGGTRGSVKYDKPLGKPLTGYSSISVDFTAKDPSWTPEASQFASVAIPRIQTMFRTVEQGADAQTDLHLAVVVEDLNRVDSGDRFLAGSMAGQARIIASAILTEKASSEVLVSGAVSGWSSRATTNDVIGFASDFLLRFLRGERVE